ncbi:hypothetical protein IQ07DRAFT_207148 [Pyrenochaeta sp. DS3sAY3a]|nr:hypothetical protein IQ07DRAFT_207148 [Pyrenochaeta sp. DS3sAY3a]
MQITLLSLHIFSYFSNIKPSIAFCSTPAVLHYPNWAFHHHSSDWRKGSERPPQLSMKARCERINWNIHVAGGFSAAVAAILATLHACAVGLRIWHCITQAWRKHSTQTRRSDTSPREEDEGIELDDWHHPPRDVDIAIRPQPPPTDRSDPPQPQTAARPATISEEERGIGSIRQRRRRVSKSKSSIARARLVALEEAKWAEALLECLVP